MTNRLSECFPISLVLVFFISTVPLVGLSQTERSPDCLNSLPLDKPFNPREHVDCLNDALHLGGDKTIVSDEKLLDIALGEVQFVGCPEAPFITSPALGLSNAHFTIYYPVNPELKRDDYMAPLLHELGHVFQIQHLGGYAKLRTSVSIERIELGADFVAGLTAAKLALEPNVFLLNLSLVGSYNSLVFDYHGRPEDRASSFRNGYFYKDKGATIITAYADFQDNRFAQIKHN